MSKNDKESPDPEYEAPPILGSWKRVYWFVAIFFFVEVVAFYIFTRYYS